MLQQAPILPVYVKSHMKCEFNYLVYSLLLCPLDVGFVFVTNQCNIVTRLGHLTGREGGGEPHDQCNSPLTLNYLLTLHIPRIASEISFRVLWVAVCRWCHVTVSPWSVCGTWPVQLVSWTRTGCDGRGSAGEEDCVRICWSVHTQIQAPPPPCSHYSSMWE